MKGLSAAVRPDRYYESLLAVDPDELARLGIRGLIMDLDNTMVPRKAIELSEDLVAWLGRAKAAGLAACIVSNNFKSRVGELADRLGLPVVARAAKPMPGAFRRGMEVLGTGPGETAVVGDQMFTDVLGGNLQGLYTIMVIPLPGRELPHTAILRRVERWLLRRWMRHDGLELEPGAR